MNGPYHKQESPIGFITCRDIRSDLIVLSFFISIVSTRRVIDFIFDRKPWSSNLSHDLHYASMTSDNSFRISRISELYILQGRHQEGAGGASAPPPPIFDRSVNPISTRGGGRLCPPLYYQPPQIFRPCDGPVLITKDFRGHPRYLLPTTDFRCYL